MTARKTLQDDFAIDEVEQSGDVAVATPAKPQSAAAATKPKGASSARPKAGEAFDPTEYLSNFDGRDYLEVKWRVMWLRHEHPEARMTTEIVQLNEEGGFALFRAEVEIPDGGKATGWGSETVRDFHDYIEAAETKALGRALAALGYGTQFCRDFDFAANARPGMNQVVDAPVRLAEPRTVGSQASHPAPFNQKANSFGNSSNGANGKSGSFGNSGFASITGGRLPAQEDDFDRIPEITPAGSGLTEKQLKAIYAIGRANMRLSEQQVDDRCAEVFGIRPAELTKAEASQFIDMLKGEAA
ncbi:MAG TPA: hypothetical protein VLQ48_01445 [Chloroflexia bacterium]|nr:hypothetical protein [Chloroflexia bacterium]